MKMKALTILVIFYLQSSKNRTYFYDVEKVHKNFPTFDVCERWNDSSFKNDVREMHELNVRED